MLLFFLQKCPTNYPIYPSGVWGVWGAAHKAAKAVECSSGKKTALISPCSAMTWLVCAGTPWVGPPKPIHATFQAHIVGKLKQCHEWLVCLTSWRLDSLSRNEYIDALRSYVLGGQVFWTTERSLMKMHVFLVCKSSPGQLVHGEMSSHV